MMRDLIAAEWIKTRSQRATPWTLGLTTVVVIAATTLSTGRSPPQSSTS